MKRREFIAGLGSAAAWPLAARAQQGDRVRRIGVLTGEAPEEKAGLSAFAQRLADLGWTVGRNVQVDVHFFAGNIDRLRTSAKELIDSQPDVILANTSPATAVLQQETRVIPIVFEAVSDPVGSGFVVSLSRPGGNITGFIDTEASMAGKWLELLIEIAPGTKRTAIMFNPDTAPGGGSYFLTSFEEAARSFKVEPMMARVHSEADFETVMNSRWPTTQDMRLPAWGRTLLQSLSSWRYAIGAYDFPGELRLAQKLVRLRQPRLESL